MLCAAVPATAAPPRDDTIPGRFIVVYEPSVATPDAETDQRERRDGFRSQRRYRHALKGFVARLSPAQAARLRLDPEVAIVAPDRAVRASATLVAGDSPPTGVRRIESASTITARSASTANVAVIDTGVDQAHPDLNTAGGTNCVTPAAAPSDDNGHGTHVAGTIAARNNGAGVVGVAPGTRIFAAKVLDAAGNGTASAVICGIDWVTGTRTDADPANDIAVANMSLGGSGPPVRDCVSTTDPEHLAVCRSVAAGVTYVVAAGNSGWDFDYAPAPDTPAAFPQVLTVTAMSDSDGAGGAAGAAPSCRSTEADDRYASFSNYAATSAGAAHTLAGPGVCISSTWKGGGYSTISGTSMATPHLAAAVALCLGDVETGAGPCAGLTPAQIVARMRSDAQEHTTAAPAFGFTGDPLHSPRAGVWFGFLGWAGGASTSAPPPPPPPPPPSPVSAFPSAVKITTGVLRGGGPSQLNADDDAYLLVASNTSSTRTSAWYGSFTGIAATLRDLRVSYRGKNSRACSQTIAIRRISDGAWVALDSRSVGTTEVLLAGLVVPGAPGAYLSSAGELRVRVRCSTSSGTFTASGDLLAIEYLR